MSQLVTASGQTQRADSLDDVPGGRRVDPDSQIEHGRKVTFHLWTDPDSGDRFILAHGEAEPATLERLAGASRYTARYGSAFDAGKTEERVAQWYAQHGVGPRGWPTSFGDDGCYVYGRTTMGDPFRMAFDRKSGRFVMRYELP